MAGTDDSGTDDSGTDAGGTHGSGPDATPVPYRRVTDVAYGREAARTFTATVLTDGITLLSGPCPRCGARITAHTVDEIVRGGSAAPYVTVVCTCEEPHPDRPESRTGCGAYWNLVLTGSVP